MDRTTRGLLVAFGVLLVVALGFSILTGGMMGPSMMGPGMMGPGMMGSGMMAPGMMSGQGWMRGLGMGLGGPAMLTFWGALIVGVVVLVRVLGTGPARHGHVLPLDVLKRRYAAGEITREEYEQTRRELERE